MAGRLILAFNSGSSTLKFGCFGAGGLDTLATGAVAWRDGRGVAVVSNGSGGELLRAEVAATGHGAAVRDVLAVLGLTGVVTAAEQRRILAVGHRIVHGGGHFRTGVLIDAAVKDRIRECAVLAPLHNPPALDVIEATEAALGPVPQAAVFDTAFHADLPLRAQVYPLPWAWHAEKGIRRFGFHGISVEYCVRRLAELESGPRSSRIVICHLGNGCSATAVRDGRPIATTMGFTPLEGLMMGSRAGSFDPGILIYLQREMGLAAETIAEDLSSRSGLLGVSGVSHDFREVQRAADVGNERAQLALEIYEDRIRASIGSLAVTLGAVDALVFTGGVGEGSARLRESVSLGLECLGIRLDPATNQEPSADRDVAAHGSRAAVWVVHTREEFMVAREARRLAAQIVQ